MLNKYKRNEKPFCNSQFEHSLNFFFFIQSRKLIKTKSASSKFGLCVCVCVLYNVVVIWLTMQSNGNENKPKILHFVNVEKIVSRLKSNNLCIHIHTEFWVVRIETSSKWIVLYCCFVVHCSHCIEECIFEELRDEVKEWRERDTYDDLFILASS